MKPPMPEFIRGDARSIPLPDASVDLIVTSPPYFGLRSYTDDGAHYAGQIGDEATPHEFIAALLDVTAECVRVLKPTGSMFINLGDRYAGGGMGGHGGATLVGTRPQGEGNRYRRSSHAGIPAKTLHLIPERYRIACVDELGLIARAVIVWSKPNGLPESVTDRVRRSHEDWVHLTRHPRYYSAVDEIREEHAGEFLASGARNPRFERPGGLMPWEQRGDVIPSGGRALADGRKDGHRQSMGRPGVKAGQNPLGKLPGSVWEVPTQPLKVPAELGIDHFAAFPFALVRPIILGWSPREVCTACGEGRRPVSLAEKEYLRPSAYDHEADKYAATATANPRQTWANVRNVRQITGSACACPDVSAPATPGTVLDPFSGTGTSALVATMLGRRGIGVELSQDYIRLAEWRASDPKERARAAGLDPDDVAKLRPQLPGQLDMFGEGEAP